MVVRICVVCGVSVVVATLVEEVLFEATFLIVLADICEKKIARASPRSQSG